MLERFLDSISSPKLGRITFEFVWDEYTNEGVSSVADLEAWVGIDETLCALADRLPSRTSSDSFSVILSVRTKGDANLENAKSGTFLEKFKEKGRVTMAPFKGFLQPVRHPNSPRKNLFDLTEWLFFFFS